MNEFSLIIPTGLKHKLWVVVIDAFSNLKADEKIPEPFLKPSIMIGLISFIFLEPDVPLHSFFNKDLGIRLFADGQCLILNHPEYEMMQKHIHNSIPVTDEIRDWLIGLAQESTFGGRYG